MSNVRLTWTLPNVSTRQRPIQHTRIEFRAAGIAEWTVQDIVASDVPQELVFVDVPPGDFEYQGIVVDTAGEEGAPVQTAISVPFDPPGQISNFTAVLE